MTSTRPTPAQGGGAGQGTGRDCKAGEVSPYSIPGWIIDLITDGVYATDVHDLPSLVTRRTRSVMLHAHRVGIDWIYLRGLLTDPNKRLATQIADVHGRRGRNLTERNRFLAEHWDETARVVAKEERWDKAEIIGFIHYVAWQVQQDSRLTGRDRIIVEVAVERALHFQMMRPVITLRDVQKAIGCKSLVTAKKALAKVAGQGGWLSLADRGHPSPDPAKRRGATFNLAPRLRSEYRVYIGTFPPPMYTPPMYTPATSSTSEDNDMSITITTTVTAGSPEAAVRAYRLMHDALDSGEGTDGGEASAPPRLTVVRSEEAG